MRLRFSREDWLELALRQLAERGPAGLTVQALCARAERTRGSLYHHFADHDALLDALLAYWAERDTMRLIDRVGRDGDPAHLNALTSTLDPDLEVGIRRLASQHPRLRSALGDVDQARIAFLVALYRDRLGEHAPLVAQLEYAAFIGLQQLEPRPSPADQTALYAGFARFILGRTRSTEESSS